LLDSRRADDCILNLLSDSVFSDVVQFTVYSPRRGAVLVQCVEVSVGNQLAPIKTKIYTVKRIDVRKKLNRLQTAKGKRGDRDFSLDLSLLFSHDIALNN
jgi:hypothetical protein